MLLFSFLVICTQKLELISLGALISFSSYIHQSSENLKRMKPLGGYANLVTGTRLILIVTASFLFSFVAKEWLLMLLVGSVLLDFVDGYLARKYKQESTFGQFFDMEVDAFFVLLMCFYYYQYQEIGWWILIPGLMRYLFKVFTVIIPKDGFVESRKKYAATIAGIFFAILLICMVFDLPYLLMLGSVAIIGSFSISLIEYVKY